MAREKFNSRLGFILVSAGCAIGLGNVWKFPYICAKYGGAAFILIYLLFLIIIGLPILIAEFSVGRGSRQSVITAYSKLQSPRGRFHLNKYVGMAGSYLLMMFYTMVCGWMMIYAVKTVTGELSGLDSEALSGKFSQILGDPSGMIFFTVLTIVFSFGVCALGLKNGVERITKVMMVGLLILMLILAVNSVCLPGAEKGVEYYLVPDFSVFEEYGLGTVVFNAMTHAFFTLSVGIGSMEIFGSYLSKDRKLTGEALSVAGIDTIVALIAGLVIIPACTAYDVPLDAGPSLLFISLPNVFNNMPGGRIWGTIFFVLMTFAALSTVIAVFENIIAMCMDNWGISRRKSVAINLPLMVVLSMPAILGFNLLSGMAPLGEGTTIMDLEDFIVSTNLLPLGSLLVVVFCTHRHGWGFDNFLSEVNEGKGISFPKIAKNYMKWILPLIIIVVYLKGYYDMFAPRGTVALIGWMSFAVAFLAVILFFAVPKAKKKERTDKVE